MWFDLFKAFVSTTFVANLKYIFKDTFLLDTSVLSYHLLWLPRCDDSIEANTSIFVNRSPSFLQNRAGYFNNSIHPAHVRGGHLCMTSYLYIICILNVSLLWYRIVIVELYYIWNVRKPQNLLWIRVRWEWFAIIRSYLSIISAIRKIHGQFFGHGWNLDMADI